MERLVFFAGVTSSLAGVCLFLYQGISYLMHNTWSTYSLYFLVDNAPASIQAQMEAHPGLAGALQACPLFLALILLGLLMTFIGSRLSSRYVN